MHSPNSTPFPWDSKSIPKFSSSSIWRWTAANQRWSRRGAGGGEGEGARPRWLGQLLTATGCPSTRENIGISDNIVHPLPRIHHMRKTQGTFYYHVRFSWNLRSNLKEQEIDMFVIGRAISYEAHQSPAQERDNGPGLRSEVNSELNFSPNFEGLVLGCIDADFCK